MTTLSKTSLLLLGLAVLPTSASAATRFSSPAGQLGAGLGVDDAQRARLYGDLAFFTQGSTVGTTATSLSSDFGFGYKILDELELQLDVPVAALFASGTTASDSQFALGNIAVSANWFDAKDSFLWKVGGGISFGPWLDSNHPSETVTVLTAASVRSFENLWLWGAQSVHLFVPGRLEIGEELRFTADAALDLAIPTQGAGEAELYFGLAPGVAYHATREFSFGARLPLNLFPTAGGGDLAQVAFEPYVRADINNAFIAARFTMNLDEPLGFSFDQGRVWGLQLALGGSF